DVSRFDVAVQDAVLMRVMHSASQFRDQFRCLSDRHRVAPDHFVKLAAFDEIHAEVAATIALAHFMNGNDKWMVEVGSGFCFPAKTLQMLFGGPGTEADHFKRYSAIETFLMGTINYALAAPAYFLQ